jgi:hypothetical protein
MMRSFAKSCLKMREYSLYQEVVLICLVELVWATVRSLIYCVRGSKGSGRPWLASEITGFQRRSGAAF